MSQGPYTIGLLNDLHQHFPDLLYQPEQFESVQDVLQYVVQIAQQSPYARGRADYHIRTMRERERMQQRDTERQEAQRREAQRREAQRREAEQKENDWVSRISSAPRVSLTESILSEFMDELLGNHPTNDDIEASTLIITAVQANQDDCAICQEPIQIGQSIRMLRHCTHRFHRACIDPWFENHPTCPTCRHDIRRN